MRQIVLVFAFLSLISLSMASPGFLPLGGGPEQELRIDVIESTPSRTLLEIRVPGLQVEDVQEDGVVYQRLKLRGAGTTPEAGKPAVPVIGRLVAIPTWSGVNVRTIEMDEDVLTGYRVYPAQEPVPDLATYEPAFTVDAEFYGQDAFYPETRASYAGPFVFRDYRVVQLLLHPISHNPATGELRVATRMVVELEHSGYDGRNVLEVEREPSRAFEPLYRSFIVNYDQVKRTSFPDQGSYLILTADAYYDDVLPLAEWKHKKGLEVVLTKLSDIGASPDTADIKDYIENAYNNWETPLEWILLVGDVGDLPCNYGMTHPYHGTPTPNDIYYARMNSDIIADIYIGRISVNNSTECQAEVNKILNYERNPYMDETSWFTEATLICGTQSGRPWEWTVRTIKQILLSHGYTQVDTLMELHGTCTATNVTNSWNDGGTFITYRGHGDPDGWYNVSPAFTNSYVQALSNGEKLQVGIAPTCNTGWYDWSSGDCFSEVVADQSTPSQPDAGAGMFASTRVSYSFHNDTLAIGCYRAVFEENLYQYSAATDWGKLYMLTYYPLPDVVTEVEFTEMQIFGEPELNIWTDVPDAMSVSHPGTLPVGSSNFTVTVSSGGPVYQAYICLWKDGDLYETGYTNTSGQKTFSVSPNSEGTMYVTVTKHNFAPYEGTAEVTGAQPPVADFIGSPTSGDAALDVDFTDLSTGSIDDWTWSFGDGDSAFVQHPSHTYDSPGWYDVSLYVSGSYGSDTELKSSYIHVTAPHDSAWLSMNASGDPILTEFETGLSSEPVFHFILANGSDTAHSVTFPVSYDTDYFDLLSLDIDSSSFPMPATWNFFENDTIHGGMGKVMLFAWTSVYAFGLPPGRSDIGTATFSAQDTGSFVMDTCFFPPANHLNYAYGPTATDYWPIWFGCDVTVVEAVCGDVNGDGSITSGDGFLVLNYFGAGPQPVSCWAANVNGDGELTTGDGFHLLNYFGAGPSLNCAPCSFSVSSEDKTKR
jgi:PKD repeat protein